MYTINEGQGRAQIGHQMTKSVCKPGHLLRETANGIMVLSRTYRLPPPLASLYYNVIKFVKLGHTGGFETPDLPPTPTPTPSSTLQFCLCGLRRPQRAAADPSLSPTWGSLAISGPEELKCGGRGWCGSWMSSEGKKPVWPY